MASMSCSNYLQLHNNNYYHKNSIFLSSSSFSSLPFSPRLRHRFFAVKTTPASGAEGGLLRKPVVPKVEEEEVEEEEEEEEKEVVDEEDDDTRGGEGWVDWEDKILEDTVPLVGFVRMILHSGKYESGDKLSAEHERTILERLLAYHPECEKKIGSGVDYITIGYHPNFERSRCLFIVRKDGEMVDFSYWKCIKGLIRKKYPLHADSFILRHFRKRRRND